VPHLLESLVGQADIERALALVKEVQVGISMELLEEL
jgi:hypothetical protein